MQLTPATVHVLLREHGIRPSRGLGQNFLADPNTARRIVRLAEVVPGDRVLEIGPGLGSLTVALRDAGAHVVALEFDRYLIPVLEEVLGTAAEDADGSEGDVTVLHGDALDADLAGLLGDGVWSCVSNLPYNVATPVVIRVLEQFHQVTRCLVMVQREVGERLVAEPRTGAYGAVSVKVAYYARARIAGTVPATVFVPRPKVASTLVRVDRRAEPPVDVPSPDALFTLVRAGFAQRRKTLRRSLRPVLGGDTESVLAAAGIASEARAEALGLPEWARLAREAA
jgi:16S rRNA (adenine1518-N6/adenine1519-N6)-dimethyltransferase